MKKRYYFFFLLCCFSLAGCKQPTPSSLQQPVPEQSVLDSLGEIVDLDKPVQLRYGPHRAYSLLEIGLTDDEGEVHTLKMNLDYTVTQVQQNMLRWIIRVDGVSYDETTWRTFDPISEIFCLTDSYGEISAYHKNHISREGEVAIAQVLTDGFDIRQLIPMLPKKPVTQHEKLTEVAQEHKTANMPREWLSYEVLGGCYLNGRKGLVCNLAPFTGTMTEQLPEAAQKTVQVQLQGQGVMVLDVATGAVLRNWSRLERMTPKVSGSGTSGKMRAGEYNLTTRVDLQ